jgi:hypothetical protein
MMRLFFRNRRGTAEVIGTMMFVMILLFLFTNVYLWHDAATKNANQLYLKEINSTFKIQQTDPNTITLTANGGSSISLSRLWIDESAANGRHLYADLGSVNVAAGQSYTLTFVNGGSNPTEKVDAQQVTGGAQIAYQPTSGQTITCTAVNTLGVTESTVFQAA